MTEPPLLELCGVSKTYGDESAVDEQVLKGIDLTVARGETLAIVGPSGCGKSTLLNIMGTLDRPTRGTVRLGGRDVASLAERDLAQVRNAEVGFVFQLHHLLPQCTVLENVLVPTLVARRASRVNARERATALLERVGLAHRLDHMPGQLSGGERQRVAVVRALINEPRLLLADEPTGSLDRAGAAALCKLLVELNRECQLALVMVTHAAELAGLMQAVVELRDGRLTRGKGKRRT
jgi:lipoprotein-releasing system ATP-binding protein